MIERRFRPRSATAGQGLFCLNQAANEDEDEDN
jgi:hypothetical protein